jgi:hypothetical protein
MILIVDTVRRAGEHLELNKAVVESLIENDRKVVFLTSRDYWESFPASMRERMEFQSTERLSSGLVGTLRSLILLVSIALFRRKYNRIVFLSSITYSSFLLSVLSYLGLIRPRVFVFLHEVSYIDSIKISAKCAGYFLKSALSIGLRNRGKFLIVGAYIKCELERRVNFNRSSTVFIEHPTSISPYHEPKKALKTIKFAAIGVQCDEKHSYKIETVADYNRELVNAGAMSLSTIGRLDYIHDLKVPVNHVGLEYDTYLMPFDDFERFILDQHYLLFFIGKEYDLKTSGTIFDAVKYQKPIIALSCNLIDFYFEKFGNIGHVYRCIDDMKSGIASLCENFDQELYGLQVRNLTEIKKQTSGIQFRREIQQLIVGKE